MISTCDPESMTADERRAEVASILAVDQLAGLYYQMVGRGFRLDASKDNCLVLDFGGNILRHGPVDALEIKDRSAGAGEAPAKECPQCQAVIHAAYSLCPECGYEFPPPKRGQHEQEASTAGILSGEITETQHAVSEIGYSVHVKRDAPEGHPRTMRVDYRVGFNDYRSEWVCIEHTGYARGKAEAWWKLRSHLPVPENVDDAVALANAGALAPALSITVRSVTGEKYDRIVKCELGPKPDPADLGELPGADTPQEESEYVPADDDIPF